MQQTFYVHQMLVLIFITFLFRGDEAERIKYEYAMLAFCILNFEKECEECRLENLRFLPRVYTFWGKIAGHKIAGVIDASSTLDNAIYYSIYRTNVIEL